MELSFITNQAGSPVLTKNGINAVSTKVIDNKYATGNYTQFDTKDSGKIILVISGTFVADITVYGRSADTDSNVRITKNIYDYFTGIEVYDGIIKKAGTYVIYNDRPYKYMYPRINAYTSGAVTAYEFDGTALETKRATKHIVKLAESLGGTIAAEGSATPITNLAIDQCAFIFFVARTNSGHAHRIGITFIHPNSLGSMTHEINIVASTVQRDGETDWIPVKGEKATFTIHNDDTANSHPYDIVVYGVV